LIEAAVTDDERCYIATLRPEAFGLADANRWYQTLGVVRLKVAFMAVGIVAIATVAKSQTVTWEGGFPDDNQTTAGNWLGDTPPLSNGTETLEFTADSAGLLILDNMNARFAGINMVSNDSGNAGVDISGDGNYFLLGSQGISVTGLGNDSNFLTFDAPVILTADQTWTQSQNSGGAIITNQAVTGSYALTLAGDIYREIFEFNSNSNTFSSLTVPGSSLNATTIVVVGVSSIGPAGAPTSGPLGTGMVSMGDGSTLTTTTASPITLSNPFTLGDSTDGGVTFGGPSGQSNPFAIFLTLSGPITLNDADTEIAIGQNSEVTFSGDLTGATAGVCLDFGNNVRNETGSLAVVQGNISNVARLDLEDDVTVIFDGSSSSQITGLEDIGTAHNTYMGLGGRFDGTTETGYAASGNVAAAVSFLNSSGSASNFQGTLGFDTTTGMTATFSDPVDLSNFTDEEEFVGLGSATNAVLSGSITPPGGSSGTYFPFGGGGGTLTVTSDLDDGAGARAVVLSAGNAPLTLILSGGLNYSGGTSVDGGVLIFGSPTPGTGGMVIGNGSTGTGYIGSLAASDGGNFQTFIDNFNGGESNGVIGFDQFGSVRMVGGTIDMSETGNGLYLGSATDVEYTGTIIPYGGQYQFSGVKGSYVQIDSALTGSNSLVVGLPNPLEGFNTSLGFSTISTVALNGVGSNFTGGTTFYSGYLYVTNSDSLGGVEDDTLTVPSERENGWAGTLAVPSSNATGVTLPNDIVLDTDGLALNTGSTKQLTLTGIISDNGDDPGELGIFGPVELDGANTYSGGTDIYGATVTLGNDTALGNSWVNAANSTLHFTSPNPIININAGFQVVFTNVTATFDGSPIIHSLALSGSTVNFNGATAEIDQFNSDIPNSNNVINLGPATQLTINTENDGPTYYGQIDAPSNGGSVVITGGDSINLYGPSGYSNGTTITTTTVIASNDTALGTGPITIGGGTLVTNTGVTLTNAINLGSEAALAGYGTFSPGGVVSFQNYSGVIPGRGSISHGTGSAIPITATLTFGGSTSLLFGPNGLYVFSITNASGSAGSDYSSVNVTGGTLSFDSPSTYASNPFEIKILSYDPTTLMSADALNFNAYQSYTWTLVSSMGISGFSSGDFSIDSSGFSNGLAGGSFLVTQSGNNLVLNFTPVPEPPIWAMIAGGIFVLAAVVRRRRVA
jgi:autotransporter-associated beta strand protein